MDRKAVCHYPWDTLYIEPDGSTFFCCHKKPYCIGNIYEESIDDIMFGETADEVRCQAADGSLPCFTRCNRAPSRRYYNAGQTVYPVPEHPMLRELHINISTRCNLSCVMCRQNHKSKTTLSHRRLIKAVNWSTSPRLTIQGGEPLVVPQAYRLARYVVSHSDSPLTLITNGTRLTRKWRRLLVTGPHECRISLNGATQKAHEFVNRGSKWEKVQKNIHLLAELKEKKQSPLYITLRMTVVPQNIHEMPAFVRFANQEGYANRITFGFDRKTVPKWVRRNPDAFLKVYEEFLNEVNRSKTLCDTWRLYQLAQRQGLEDRKLRFGPKGQLLSE